MEIVPEGKLVESEDDLKLCQQNNGNWKDKYKQGRRFEDQEEGELSENTKRLAGLRILEEPIDAYEQICCSSNISLSSSSDLFNKNQGVTSVLIMDSQNKNGIQEDILKYGGEEDYVILPMKKFEELYDYELDLPMIQTKYLSEQPGSNLTNVDFLESLTTIGIKGNLWNIYWKKPYGHYQMKIEGLYYKILWAQEDLNIDGLGILGGTICWCHLGLCLFMKSKVLFQNGKAIHKEKNLTSYLKKY
ncbi:hypothetical protein O181_006876 [Austropuccinia psidii MF-1]|uniref:Uncharacterized protein n=1 Tax=Austropuccinia psidii MF-1 TaxID=1389203 RepID=A0A9Q3BJU6_9BASI|nr:hypothetical protein [Austropuccinia psidii MF-1]